MGHPAYFPLPIMKNDSLYNLNLVESETGKLYHNMNVDESYIPEQQIFGSASSSSSTNVSTPLSMNVKMPDEVFRDFIRQEEQCSDEKPTIFGKTTLDNFLMRNGAINGLAQAQGESQSLLDPMGQRQAEWMHYQMADAQQLPLQRMTLLGSNMPMYEDVVMNGGFTENMSPGMPVVSMGMVPTSSDTGTLAETIRSEENMEKSIERRQKRMIKNRESAARSRMKKQAYIHELETAVNKLKRENEELRKQKEVQEMLSNLYATQEPRHQLRRTSSASF